MVDAAAKLTGRVERVLEGIANRPEKKYLVLNKVDLTRKDKLLTIATEINARVAFDETFFIAASNGDGVPELKAHLADRKSVVSGKRWSGRLVPRCPRNIKKKTAYIQHRIT